MTFIDQALGAFIDDWNAGRRPDVDECLASVPEADRAELARLLSTWLDVAPVPDYDEAALAEIEAEPALQAAFAAMAEVREPLPSRLAAMRERAGLAVREVGDRVAAAFGLTAPGQADKAAAYLEQLEDGRLDAGGLSDRLLDALASILGVDRDRLAPGSLGMPAAPAAPAAAGGQLFRADEEADEWIAADLEALSKAAMTPAPPPLDDVDRLFRGGPEG